MRLLIIIAALIVMGSAVFGYSAFVTLPIEVIAKSDGDDVRLERAECLTLHVRSPGGIGSTTLARSGKNRFAPFEVRLYLKALEGFEVRSGSELHRISVTSQGDVLLEPEASYVLHMNELGAIEKGQYFSVTVNPAGFAEPVTELRLDWIDYYR